MSYEEIQKTGNWVFVIDTEQYAGSFERELTAYVTGQVGDCEVGYDLVKYYTSETGDENHERFDNLLEHRSDENGCRRPCAIYPTPGWFNTGYGEHFKNGQEVEALEHYKTSVKNYHTNTIKERKRIRAVLEAGEKYSNWTIADCDREISQNEDRIEEELALTTVHKYPAYLSVAIFFESKPSAELVAFMKERVKIYSLAESRENFRRGKTILGDLKVTGFRLIKENISVEEETV